MNRRFFVKQKIALILIGFSLIAIAAIFYTLNRSIELDREHIQLVENSEKIEIKIFDARIKYGNYRSEPKPALIESIDSLFVRAFLNIEIIAEIASREFSFKSQENKEFTKDLMLLRESISEIEPILKNSIPDISTSELDKAFRSFDDTFTQYEKALHLYINQTNQKFKRNIFFLLASLLLLLIVSLVIVIRLMNSLTQAHVQLVRNTMTVEQRERKRIARELHDGLGALLSSIGLYGKMLGKELQTQEKSLEKVKQINQLSKQALDTVSEVINNLNPSVLNRYTLKESLERLAIKINKLDHVNVQVDLDNFQGQPQQSTQVIIYRICSELINNTLKHAGASNITIKLSGVNVLILHYSDNGIGFDFDVNKTKAGSGMGLQNIIERVESINGSYHVQTAENKGFQIKIQFALSKINRN
ncbi:sensor histidine kinase [Marinifilum caeruleilacunae]|uniref:histidine kinase n=1 Tax=Marinifilum caeruleilacunae TaxID=2499076 RepID=A0ABX1WPY9_9BACT|nr:histidine kinase [Marinifilum caeruleilacunae]NOU58181.1 hypothetical protein [Marinifilum caeruleilacunae]